MDIRSYFKGDTSPPSKITAPKSPPRPTILELPELFISSAGAAAGVKRSLSTVIENVEDIERVDDHHVDYGVHKVLSHLEVRVPTTGNKPNPPTRKKRTKATRYQDDLTFAEDLDEHLHKPFLPDPPIDQNNTKLKKKTPNFKNNTDLQQQEHITSPSKQQTKTHTNSNTTNTNSHTNTTPNTQPKPAQTNATNTNIHAPPIKPKPPAQPPAKKATKTLSDPELEIKIQEKMESVQMWQDKCTELRGQLAHATTQFTNALDELDHLNSLYENSNGQ